jgi:hypothetical protein
MYKSKIKKLTAVSVVALALGVSSASAVGGKVASDGANESKKSLGEKGGKISYRMVDLGSGALSESKISKSNNKITFSMEWLKGLTLEEKKEIDFSQVDFSEFLNLCMKKFKSIAVVTPSLSSYPGAGDLYSDAKHEAEVVEAALKEYRALASKLNNAGIGHST